LIDSIMYGGLFGDLPSAKTKKDGNSSEEKRQEPVEPKPSLSAVAGLGAAGTSMAFVPTAVRPRKKPKPLKSTLAARPPALAPKVDCEPPTDTREESATVKKEDRRQDSNAIVIENIHYADQGQPQLDPTLQYDEELDQNHASATDPYDPHFPNDLLAYRERKAIEQERLRLEREARETLERQQRLRQQLHEERKKIQESGNVSDLVELHSRMGRGRGINNLPAWLLKKQKEEQLGKGEKVSARTLILSNLTAPNEIDDDLGEEVKEECEELCGPVEAVEVKDAQPPHQPEVQVWVRFKTAVDADKAANLFHGRIFAQRRITAKRESE